MSTANIVTEIYLIRHGQTISNIERRIQGQSDSPLTDLGKQQADRLAKRLGHLSFDAVYSSDLGRALSTAERLTKAMALPVYQDPRLREIGFGRAEGSSWDDMQQSHPDVCFDWYHHKAYACMPEGESREDATRRVVELLTELTSRHNGQRVMAITHGSVLACLLTWVLQIPKGIRPFCLIENTGVNILRYKNGTWKIKTWNDTSHLYGDEA